MKRAGRSLADGDELHVIAAGIGNTKAISKTKTAMQPASIGQLVTAAAMVSGQFFLTIPEARIGGRARRPASLESR